MKLKKLWISAMFLTFLFTCGMGKAVNAMESKKVVLESVPKSAAQVMPAKTPRWKRYSIKARTLPLLSTATS